METVREYLETQVLTASPYRLHLMVVDGAIRFARQGLDAIEREDWELLERTLERSRECVSELLVGLRSDAGSDVTDSLKALFTYVFRNLAVADPERNPQLIHNALRILETHRETWIELAEHLTEADHSAAAVPQPHALSWTS